eukprot:12003117-Karenia_brevis.AAC.1
MSSGTFESFLRKIYALGETPVIFSVDLNNDTSDIPDLAEALDLGYLIDSVDQWNKNLGRPSTP